MEKQIFEAFMLKRFPHVNKENYYYEEWKSRFEGNPTPYMDRASKNVLMQVFKEFIEG